MGSFVFPTPHAECCNKATIATIGGQQRGTTHHSPSSPPPTTHLHHPPSATHSLSCGWLLCLAAASCVCFACARRGLLEAKFTCAQELGILYWEHRNSVTGAQGPRETGNSGLIVSNITNLKTTIKPCSTYIYKVIWQS